MRRSGRVRACGLAATLAAVAIAWAPPVAQAVPGAEGRVTLLPRAQVLDTRDLAGPKPTTVTTPIDGIVQVTVVDPTADGTLTVHPCGSAPGAIPLLRFEAGETAETKIHALNSCLTSTTPAHFVVDRVGTISATPVAGALQYVPIASSLLVFDDTIATTAGASVVRPITLPAAPADAQGAVLKIEILAASGAGAVAVGACTGARADVTWSSDDTEGNAIAYVPIGGGAPCVTAYGGSPLVHVSLFGWLETEGPMTDRLPPLMRFDYDEVFAPGFRPLTPNRLLDTRIQFAGGAPRPLADGETYTLTIPQATANTRSVVLNVTAVSPSAEGFVTAYPCDETRPTASNLNFVAGETVPNLVTVKLSGADTVCLFTQRSTHLLADISGTFEYDGGFGAQPITPNRLLDTRIGTGAPLGKVVGGQTVVLQVANRGGVPATGALAATLNVTVVEPELEGFITVFPCDQPQPVVSNLNYVAGQTVPNLVSVGLSASGTVCLFAQRTTHLIADVTTWFGPTQQDGFIELTPNRLLDTRVPTGVPVAAKVPAGGIVRLPVAAAGAWTAVTMNVTIVDPAVDGFATVFPCDQTLPTASNLNYTPREVVANLVTVSTSADGAVCFFAQRETHLVADLAGFFSEASFLFGVPRLVEFPLVGGSGSGTSGA